MPVFAKNCLIYLARFDWPRAFLQRYMCTSVSSSIRSCARILPLLGFTSTSFSLFSCAYYKNKWLQVFADWPHFIARATLSIFGKLWQADDRKIPFSIYFFLFSTKQTWKLCIWNDNLVKLMNPAKGESLFSKWKIIERTKKKLQHFRKQNWLELASEGGNFFVN